MRVARPVRRADMGNGPGATRAPRPCPTQLRRFLAHPARTHRLRCRAVLPVHRDQVGPGHPRRDDPTVHHRCVAPTCPHPRHHHRCVVTPPRLNSYPHPPGDSPRHVQFGEGPHQAAPGLHCPLEQQRRTVCLDRHCQRDPCQGPTRPVQHQEAAGPGEVQSTEFYKAATQVIPVLLLAFAIDKAKYYSESFGSRRPSGIRRGRHELAGRRLRDVFGAFKWQLRPGSLQGSSPQPWSFP